MKSDAAEPLPKVSYKIVYYGPESGGKSTNLTQVHESVPPGSRGALTSLAPGSGGTGLPFDYMPVDLGNVAGTHTILNLYTVPGHADYAGALPQVVQGADGIVFVADSAPARQAANRRCVESLTRYLGELGRRLEDVPRVFQYNRRDLPDALPVAELEANLNPAGAPHVLAIACRGEGVLDTLKQMTALVLAARRR